MVELVAASASLAKAVGPSAIQLLTKVGKEKYDRFIATYTNVFADHVRSTNEKCSMIKTLLYRDQPVSLESQYVSLTLRTGENYLSDENCIAITAVPGSASLISGLAGSGKSVFMKWAALRLIYEIERTQRIPLFVEIRDVPQGLIGKPLDQVIFEMTSSDCSPATFEQFYIGLTEGIFVVLIDGLDEVPISHRDALLNEIADFKRRFPSATLIASSRPDRQLESKSALQVYHVQEMSLEQITDVIRKAIFSEEKKTAFISSLRGGLYSRHKSFLSNPLLATIMLITFDVGSGVPSKLSLFYSQVFEALFYKHDSSKGVYQREHYCSLEIDEFENVFGTFCFQSYAMSKISFSQSELTRLTRQALEICLVKSKPENFIKDCKKSLCLLQEDGLLTTFVHRSFQEYFAARFLASYGGTEYPHLVDEIITKSFSDSTFEMLCQIDPEDVLRRWGLPKVNDFLARLSAIDMAEGTEVLAFMRSYLSSIYFEDSDGSGLSVALSVKNEHRFVSALHTLVRACGMENTPYFISGNIFRDGNPENASDRLYDVMEPELNEIDDPDIDDDERLEPTGRSFISISRLDAKLVLETGLMKYMEDLSSSLKRVQKEAIERLEARDSFARKVTGLFTSG